MELIRTLFNRCTALFRRQKLDEELDEELRSHIDFAVEEKMKRGMSAQEARTEAMRALGGVTQTKEAYRVQRGFPSVEMLGRDLRYALRQLLRNPGFTLTVILTLALSVGANTAIFSMVNALMLNSLPYAHPERMGAIYARAVGPLAFDEQIDVDGEQWEALRDHVPALISAVASETSGASGVNLRAGEHVQYVHAGRISAHYLDVLSVHPVAGRNFLESEDLPHGPKTAILSYGLWRNTFGGDRDLLGQAILLKGEPYTVIGVLPEGAITPLNADVYTALQPSREGEGAGSNYEPITRLRDGATWQQADAEISRTWADRAANFAKHNPGVRLSYYSVPLQKAQTAELRPKVLALMLAAGFILLIACANLAGLALVRILRRTPEIATRLALGASHWRVQKQLWVENLILALGGGLAGVGVGFLTLRGLLRLLPENYLPVASVTLDGRVLAFTLVVSLLTSVLFGMLPALATRNMDLRSSMASRAETGGHGLRLRQALIAGEVALTVVLLAASGLLIRTLIHLETLPAGFNPEGVMTAKASLDDARYHDPAAFRKLLDETTAAMQKIPGVQVAAVGLTLPYERALNDAVTINGGKEAGQQFGTDVVYITPGYFDALQIPVLLGRRFTEADGPNAQPVVIVNRSFMSKFFHGAVPVGRTLNKNAVIVGVVDDVQLSSGLNPVAPLMTEETMYIPAAQMNERYLQLVHIWFQPSWIVRTAAPVEGLTAQMQRALASADPGLPFSGFYSMSDLRAKTLATQRVEVALLSAMAGLALLLSMVGIFALMANLVAQRTREIGIRIALGSSIRQAMIHVGVTGVRASILGLMAGLVLCAGVLRAMRSVLYGVRIYDAPTILAVVLTLAAVTLLAASIPVLRIARIDPVKTLREV
ncbi:MAG: ADOP family duplicated permease [Terracidiphilus sp.]